MEYFIFGYAVRKSLWNAKEIYGMKNERETEMEKRQFFIVVIAHRWYYVCRYAYIAPLRWWHLKICSTIVCDTCINNQNPINIWFIQYFVFCFWIHLRICMSHCKCLLCIWHLDYYCLYFSSFIFIFPLEAFFMVHGKFNTKPENN